MTHNINKAIEVWQKYGSANFYFYGAGKFSAELLKKISALNLPKPKRIIDELPKEDFFEGIPLSSFYKMSESEGILLATDTFQASMLKTLEKINYRKKILFIESNTDVEDDTSKLDKLLDKNALQDELFQPTNYWRKYTNELHNYLKDVGLKAFRSQAENSMNSFGSLDVFHHNNTIRNTANDIVIQGTYLDTSLFELAFDRCSEYGKSQGALPLESFSPAILGGCTTTTVSKKPYTWSSLYYYLRYCFAEKINLSDIETIVEIGSGIGSQAEVTMKLHPDKTYLMFDLPGQLYIAEQNLSKIFPDKVVSSVDTMEWDNLDGLKKGKIHCFPNWKIGLLKNLKIDLFWNAASFQEMEPELVKFYLSHIDAEYYYLQQDFNGKHKANSQGEGGVIEPITLEFYKEHLPCDLIHFEDSKLPLGLMKKYHDSLWRRN